MLAADFHLRPSRIYMLMFGVFVYCSIVILCMVALPLWLKLIAVMAVVLYGACVFWQHILLRNKTSITDIRYTSEKRWVIQNREGTFAVDLHPATTVTTLVMLLHFRVPGKLFPQKSVIFRDSLSKDDFRKLLVILNA